MPKASTKKATTTTATKKKKDIKSDDHWSKRMSKPADKSKRIIKKSEIDPDNVLDKNVTRKRKEIDYRDLNLGRAVKKVKRTSSNVLEKRQANPTKRITKQKKTTTGKKSASKKEEK